MSEEKLTIGEAFLNPIIQNIEEVLDSLDKQGDLQKSLRGLSELGAKIKAFPDFEDSPENRFISFLIWAMVVQAEFNIKNQSPEALKANETELQKLKAALAEYLINVRQGLKAQSYQQIIESTKNYFNVADKLSI